MGHEASRDHRVQRPTVPPGQPLQRRRRQRVQHQDRRGRLGWRGYHVHVHGTRGCRHRPLQAGDGGGETAVHQLQHHTADATVRVDHPLAHGHVSGVCEAVCAAAHAVYRLRRAAVSTRVQLSRFRRGDCARRYLGTLRGSGGEHRNFGHGVRIQHRQNRLRSLGA